MVVELCWITSAGPAIRIVGEQLSALVARRLQRLAIVEHGAAAIELGLAQGCWRPPLASFGSVSVSTATVAITRSVTISVSWSRKAWP